ncbi:type IV secretory system conjugative DNA transfer family protein, partial [Patescibacteria group bacterium]|nr:type IV secretory system conjugative DNA transfer family protein [Patescibacteria group bacterium]MBU1703377.1 type IV secretory system conjugative DNA transfer family protein [Patescibacteria group bacterium]
KEAVGVAAHMFESLHSIYRSKIKYYFIGQDFFSLEYAAIDNQINFYVVAPKGLKSLIEKQITAFYPDAYVEQVQDYSIFKENSKVAATTLQLSKDYIYPIKTYEHLNSDPLNNITNALSKLGFDDGAAIQLVVRPKKDGWQKKGREMAKDIFSQKKSHKFSWNPLTWLGGLFEILVMGGDAVAGDTPDSSGGRTTPLTDEEVKALESKNSKVGYDTVLRIVCAAPTDREAQGHLDNVVSAFAQYSSPTANSLKKPKVKSDKIIVRNFILRNLKRGFGQVILRRYNLFAADELASLFHLPNIRYNKAPTIAWQNFKIAAAPHNIPKEGILLGYNVYRGDTKEIRMKNEDRFRHFYVIGQTGTGKSSILQVMIRQDLANGNGLAVVDPHGSLIEDILPFIPRERADDVIYFNPSDLERPMGLNLLEGDSWEEKEYVALEAMNIMIKLFNEEIFGPRIQDYFRNGCLTLMSDPEGGAITDIVRLFTDDDFQKLKVEHVTNPIVRSFWEHQMAKTGAREKQEMIPYFAAKFGQFVTNSMMRNIIGQAKSAFDFKDVMNEKKILLMNLSKGDVGEINSHLLGLIIVSKIQMAALARQKQPKEQRRDFFLYIDEFQNYVTDSIEVILSEARKYRLGLNMAHQYLAQLEGPDGKSKVKDAVFGNVGTMMCYKVGAQDAEFLAKEMAPVFSDQDLINIDKHKAVMKLSIDTQPSKPFSIIPVNPHLEKGDYEAAEAYKQLSRLKYGRDREFAEREILRRVGAVF